MAPRNVRLLGLMGVAALTDCAAPPPQTSDTAGAVPDPDSGLVEIGLRIQAENNRIGVEADGLSSSLRNWGLQSTWDLSGTHVVAEASGHDLDLTFVAWGREGNLAPVAPVIPELGACYASGEVDVYGQCLTRAEYHHPGVVEWWASRPAGLQQGWELWDRPDGDGLVAIEVAVHGAQVEVAEDGLSASFVQPGRTWDYSGLVAWDASGRDLPAELVAMDGGYRVLVDDLGAQWPIFVDPLINSPIQTITGTTDTDFVGYSLARGDVNGDGNQDVVVGAPYADFDTVNAGAVYIYLGTGTALSTTPVTTMAWGGVSNGARYGYSVAVGRLNNDIYDDVVVGCPNCDFNSKTDNGLWFLHYGSKTTFDGNWDSYDAGSANNTFLGTAVEVANLDKANYDEVLVGAPQDGSSKGFVRIYADTDGSWPTNSTSSNDCLGANSKQRMGTALDAGVDVNADGYEDFIAGAPSEGTSNGQAVIYRGNATLTNVCSSGFTTLSGGKAEGFGRSVALAAGSINGDAFVDAVVGVPDRATPAVAVFYGDGGVWSNTTVDLTYVAPASNDEFGASVATGDWNADGFDDVLVGSPTASSSAGAVYEYDGASSPDIVADWSYTYSEPAAELGFGLLFVDLDKDIAGDHEVVIGVHKAGAKDSGQLLVFGEDISVSDADKDGQTKSEGDCNDADPLIYKGATEDTYLVDRDCDDNVMCYTDGDKDGFGALPLTEETDSDKNCDQIAQGTADDATDCNDSNGAIKPGATESTFNVDMDCDTFVGCYLDFDKDTYGLGSKIVEDNSATKLICNDPASNLADKALDCADTDPLSYPGATEDTYGVDRDCDGNWLCYEDLDQDTFGSAIAPMVEEVDGNKNCNESGQKTADDKTDCDDTNNKIYLGALEDTYGVDKNCNSKILCYYDGDQDGFGLLTKLVEDNNTDKNCDDKGSKLANDGTDCLDTDVAYYLGAPETTYGQDRDCDENLLCYEDLDQDKFGSKVFVEETDKDKNCDEFGDKVANDNTDCLDTDLLAYPAAPEIVGNGLDESCDGTELCYVDSDKDTWGAFTTKTENTVSDPDLLCETAESEATKSGDCNDTNPGITNTGVPEVVGNGSDEDCDNFDQCYVDVDKDGHTVVAGTLTKDAGKDGCLLSQGEGGAATPLDDCDDTLATVYTGAVEIVADGLDNDCNGTETCYADADQDAHAPTAKTVINESVDGDFTCEAGDGEASAAGPFDDCDDASKVRFTGNVEICGNGIDEDCKGLDHGSTADDDKDGVDYGKESLAKSNDCVSDSDGDGVLDGVEYGVGALAQNTDSTDLPDILDLDDDNDGVATKDEGSVLDTDLDTIKNYLDADDDGDGLASASEGAALKLDSDKDGIFDYLDKDDDNDLIDTKTEAVGDADGDGLKNYLDDDDDGDGILSKLEGPATKDSDADTTPDYLDADDDGDGVATKVESLVTGGDTDNDGKPDYLDADDDGDGVLTKVEGTVDIDADKIANYLDTDDDNDSITTLVEGGVTDTDADGTLNYLDADDDGDFIATSVEGASANFDLDGALNYLDNDDDNDGVPTRLEDFNKNGNPVDDDGDGDGAKNYLDTDDDNDTLSTLLEDVDKSGSAANEDSDGDGLPNFLDSDDDNDTILTSKEDTNSNKNWYDDDVDTDTIPDFLDSDDDNDGVPTIAEDTNGDKNPANDDQDGDGKPNYLDTDDDADGIATKSEVVADTDGDGLKNFLDADDDGDGLLTKAEFVGDTDLDGKQDYLDSDDDNDFVLTKDEDLNKDGKYDEDTDKDSILNYRDTDDDGDTVASSFDGAADSDNDKTANYLDTDDDGDGIATKLEDVEIKDGNPSNDDTDNDTLPDFLDPDDDGDGIPTSVEDTNKDGNWFNDDTDKDGVVDYLDGDDDQDGIPSLAEDINKNKNLTDDDSDGDGIPNYLDTDDDNDGLATKDEDSDGSGSPANDDMDGDLLPNHLDTDSDGDGFTDSAEGRVDSDKDGAFDFVDGDSDGDTISDALESKGDTDKDGKPDRTDNDDDGDGYLTADSNFGEQYGNDTDKDGVPNYLDADDDADEIDTKYERLQLAADGDGANLCGYTASHLDPDSDDDGVDDGDEWEGLEAGSPNGSDDAPRDSDFDSCVNALDPDDDNDGIETSFEGGEGPQYDVDGDPTKLCAPAPDGLPNYLDTDSDGDADDTGDDSKTNTKDKNSNGPDGVEVYEADADNDGVPDILDCLDNDGCDGDPDGDGLTNCEERKLGSLGTSADSDGDGLSDGDEVGDLAFPANSDGDLFWSDVNKDGLVDGGTWTDANGDGEIQAAEFVGKLWSDTDKDGRVDDGEGEVRAQFDLIDPDDDGDHVDTSVELKGADGTGTATDPGDSDEDGTPDYLDTDDDGDAIATTDEDVSGNFDPTDDDTDGDGIPNYLDPSSCEGPTGDCDGDEIANQEETDCGLNPGTNDTDGDGVPDGVEVCLGVVDCDPGAADALNDACDVLVSAANHDDDTVPDVLDTDDDNDGVPTKDEGAFDLDGDGKPNSVDTDSDGDGVADADESMTDDPDCDGAPSLLDFDETDGPCLQAARDEGGDTDIPIPTRIPACGCAAGSSGSYASAWAALVAVAAVLRRRRRV